MLIWFIKTQYQILAKYGNKYWHKIGQLIYEKCGWCLKCRNAVWPFSCFLILGCSAIVFCLTLSVKSSLRKIPLPFSFCSLFRISSFHLNLRCFIMIERSLLAFSSNFPLWCTYSISINLGSGSNLSASSCLTFASVACYDSFISSGTPSVMTLLLCDWISRYSDFCWNFINDVCTHAKLLEMPFRLVVWWESLLLKPSKSFCENWLFCMSRTVFIILLNLILVESMNSLTKDLENIFKQGACES